MKMSITRMHEHFLCIHMNIPSHFLCSVTHESFVKTENNFLASNQEVFSSQLCSRRVRRVIYSSPSNAHFRKEKPIRFHAESRNSAFIKLFISYQLAQV